MRRPGLVIHPVGWLVGLGWVGLGWVGLGWVGLGWVGLGWVGWLVRWFVGIERMFYGYEEVLNFLKQDSSSSGLQYFSLDSPQVRSSGGRS